MENGTLCQIKSKKNCLKSFVVLYPNLDEIIEARTKRNEWLPSIVSETKNIKLPIKEVILKPVNEYFAILDSRQDCNGNYYYRCLYNDTYGWIIDNRNLKLKKEI